MRELIEDIDGEKITSKAENLPADSFNTYNEFEKFVIEHEYQHSLYSREDFNNDFPNGTKGEYETAINVDGTVKTGEAADAAIGKLGKFLKVCS